MSNKNVIQIETDTLFYIEEKGDGVITGVGDKRYGIEIYNASNETVCVVLAKPFIAPKHKFRDICIAWLALNYPDVLKFDDTK